MIEISRIGHMIPSIMMVQIHWGCMIPGITFNTSPAEDKNVRPMTQVWPHIQDQTPNS